MITNPVVQKLVKLLIEADMGVKPLKEHVGDGLTRVLAEMVLRWVCEERDEMIMTHQAIRNEKFFASCAFLLGLTQTEAWDNPDHPISEVTRKNIEHELSSRGIRVEFSDVQPEDENWKHFNKNTQKES